MVEANSPQGNVRSARVRHFFDAQDREELSVAKDESLLILLDHDVPAERIIFVCLFATRRGLSSILYAFPKVRVVVASVQDPKDYNFGDRFFGTA